MASFLNSQLIKAVENGDISSVKANLNRGVKPNIRDEEGWTILMNASYYGHIEVVRVLLDRGAQVNAALRSGSTPLMLAVQKGHIEVVRVLLDVGAQVNAVTPQTRQSSLHNAAVRGNVTIVNILLDAKASVNGQTWTGSTPLFIASQEGFVDCVEALISRGADIEMGDRDGTRALHRAARKNKKEVVELLVRKGAVVDQTDNNGLTPLMRAALEGADDAIQILLSHGANPDKVNKDGNSALVLAIQSKLSQTSLLLLPKTRVTGERGAIILGRICRKGLETVAKMFLDNIRNYDEGEKRIILWSGLKEAAMFGEDKLVHLILKEVGDEEEIKILCQEFLELSVESDRAPAVKAIVDNLSHVTSDLVNVPSEVVNVAFERRVPKVIDSLLEGCSLTKSDKKKISSYSTEKVTKDVNDIVEAVKKNPELRESLLTKVPKSEEGGRFSYHKIFEGFMTELMTSPIKIESAISKLRAPEVHLKQEDCPEQCNQKQICSIFRETQYIIEDILKKIGERMRICEGATVKIIGSILEGTRLGLNDEMDTFVKLDDKIKNNLLFDTKTQELKVTNHTGSNMDILAPYVTNGRKFDGEKFFNDFIETAHEVMQTYKIPITCPISREFLHLSTAYGPCAECVDIKYGTPIFTRCCHTDTLDPSLCSSKVGLVLHLGWKKTEVVDGEEKNIWIHRMDVDLTCPKIPNTTPTDGEITEIITFLEETKPVGWLDEREKLSSTAAAGGDSKFAGDETVWLAFLRKINRKTVIGRMMLPFMRSATLKGAKLQLYLLLKIIKMLTAANTRSFDLKYAMDFTYTNNLPDLNQLGEAVEKVLQDPTMKVVNWGVIHPYLAKEGYIGLCMDSLKRGYLKLVKLGEQSGTNILGKVEVVEAELSEKEMLQLAIDLSLEGDSTGEGVEEEVGEDEEEMMRMAIAMSLE